MRSGFITNRLKAKKPGLNLENWVSNRFQINSLRSIFKSFSSYFRIISNQFRVLFESVSSSFRSIFMLCTRWGCNCCTLSFSNPAKRLLDNVTVTNRSVWARESSTWTGWRPMKLLHDNSRAVTYAWVRSRWSTRYTAQTSPLPIVTLSSGCQTHRAVKEVLVKFERRRGECRSRDGGQAVPVPLPPGRGRTSSFPHAGAAQDHECVSRSPRGTARRRTRFELDVCRPVHSRGLRRDLVLSLPVASFANMLGPPRWSVCPRRSQVALF